MTLDISSKVEYRDTNRNINIYIHIRTEPAYHHAMLGYIRLCYHHHHAATDRIILIVSISYYQIYHSNSIDTALISISCSMLDTANIARASSRYHSIRQLMRAAEIIPIIINIPI